MIMEYQGAMMSGPAPSAGELAFGEKPIRVMIVDDSAVVRGLVSRWIGEEAGMEVVARHANGKLAVADVVRSAPDLILLDVEMPVMDGLEALPLLLKARPGVRVLMVSTLTKRNAEISFKALSLGALDYLPKPDSNSELTLSADFRGEVIRKIKALGPVRLPRADLDGGAPQAAGKAGSLVGHGQRAFRQRPFSLVPPRVLAIGSSTGGPQALASVLGALSPWLTRVPVLIAQHMPPMFTAVLAERLSKASGRDGQGRARRRAGQARHHLCCAGRASYDGDESDRPSLAHRRRAAGAFLPACGRSPVQERRRHVRRGVARCRADRHGP